ncbi:hypothetical protein [Streptomyces sp. NPDC007369]
MWPVAALLATALIPRALPGHGDRADGDGDGADAARTAGGRA